MRHQIKCSGCPEQARPGQAYCTACQKRQRRKHYEENKATYIARAKASKEATRALIRAMVLEAKTGKVCADCLLPHPPWRLQLWNRRSSTSPTLQAKRPLYNGCSKR